MNEAAAAFIDCCVRSLHYKAENVMAAASYLTVVCCMIWPLRGLTSAAASALASVVKKAAACVTASGNAQRAAPMPAKPQDLLQADEVAETAAQCFAAAVPRLIERCFTVVCRVALGAAASSSSDVQQQQQQQASIALLAVLLARTLVVLTDAMDAAAEAAGMTPAQLYARWGQFIRPS
jgi:hypothetical protein